MTVEESILCNLFVTSTETKKAGCDAMTSVEWLEGMPCHSIHPAGFASMWF